MPYKHKIVQGLAELIEKYGGKSHDPFMAAVWYGIKSQVPSLLQTLDSSEAAIAEIERKLREVLEPEVTVEYIVEPKPVQEVAIEIVPKTKPRRRARKAAAEAEKPAEQSMQPEEGEQQT